MKRVVIWLFVTSFTFTLGVGAWLYFSRTGTKWFNKNLRKESTQVLEKPGVRFVSFCDLESNPKFYDQTIIRTRAILSVGKDTRTLWDSGCSNFQVSAECFHPPDRTCEGIFTTIDKFRGGKPGEWLGGQTAVELIGQFFVHGESGRYEMEILEIKDARAIRNHSRSPRLPRGATEQALGADSP